MFEANACKKCGREASPSCCLTCRAIRNCLRRLRGKLDGDLLEECDAMIYEVERLLELEYERGHVDGYARGKAKNGGSGKKQKKA